MFNRFVDLPYTLALLITKVNEKHRVTHITDLGSGAGGAMPDAQEILHKESGMPKVKLTLTDLFPNQDAIRFYNSKKVRGVSYDPEPLSATSFADRSKGMKTMINCFHHMKPCVAKEILLEAQKSKEPFLIYELVENKIPLLLWWILLPVSLLIVFIMSLIITPFVKPMKWYQLVFTYLIPIIPIFYAWDGQASMPRIYAFKDIEEMLEEIKTPDYQWEMGHALNRKGKKSGIYIIGIPTES